MWVLSLLVLNELKWMLLCLRAVLKLNAPYYTKKLYSLLQGKIKTVLFLRWDCWWRISLNSQIKLVYCVYWGAQHEGHPSKKATVDCSTGHCGIMRTKSSLSGTSGTEDSDRRSGTLAAARWFPSFFHLSLWEKKQHQTRPGSRGQEGKMVYKR